MPSAPHPAAPRALGFGDDCGAVRCALGGEVARDILGRLDFLEVVDLAADGSRLMVLDRGVRMLRHRPRADAFSGLARWAILRTGEDRLCPRRLALEA